MIYLKLRINQDLEWSPVTISSLAKMLVGVNNMVVENLDFSADDKVPDRISVISADVGFVVVKLPDTTAEADFADGVLWTSETVSRFMLSQKPSE